MDYRLILYGGGARAGKSRHALERARSLGTRRLFVATGVRVDDEMRRRIERHRADRGEDFTTVEEPHDLPGAIRAAGGADVVLVDCVTFWLSNLLVAGAAVETALARVDELCEALAARGRHVVLVTNEVGMGLVPDTPLGRDFRDLAGHANQRIASICDEVHFAAMGLLLRLK